MSDDDDEVLYVRTTKEKVIHYGSLEEQERSRQAKKDTTGSLASDAISAGIKAGNINVSTGELSNIMLRSFEVDQTVQRLLSGYKGY